jgi:hypothetical protein
MPSGSPLSDSTALDPLFSELGATLVVCQGFEQSLVMMLSIVQMEEQEMADGSLQAAVEELSQKTLGQLLRKIRSRLDLPAALDDQFRIAWEKRSWVVHGFLPDASATLAQAGGQAVVVQQLLSAKAAVRVANSQAEAVLDEYTAQFGPDIESLQVEVRERWSELYPAPNSAPLSKSAA